MINLSMIILCGNKDTMLLFINSCNFFKLFSEDFNIINTLGWVYQNIKIHIESCKHTRTQQSQQKKAAFFFYKTKTTLEKEK